MKPSTTGAAGRRRTITRLVSLVLTAVAIVGIVWWVANQREAVWAAIGGVPPVVLVAAAVLFGLGNLLTMLAWRELAVPRDGKLSVRTASAFFFQTQLGKYLPGGGVWPLVAQSYLADTLAMSRAQMMTVSTVSLGLSLLCRAALAVAIVPAIVPALWWMPLIALAGFVLLVAVPGAFVALLSRLPRWGGLDGPGTRALCRRIRRSSCYAAAGAVVTGLHVWVLVIATGGDAVTSFYPAVAALALATVLSSIAVFLPAGIGARELVMVGVLGRLVAQPSALAIAVLSRLVTTVVEIAMAAMFRRPIRNLARAREERSDHVRTSI